MDPILKKIKSIIAEELICQPIDLNETDTFTSYGLDALDKVIIATLCDEAFGIQIPESETSAILTIADLHAAVLRQGITA